MAVTLKEFRDFGALQYYHNSGKGASKFLIEGDLGHQDNSRNSSRIWGGLNRVGEFGWRRG